MLSDTEGATMIREIARTQAQLYYKLEEAHSPLVVQSVLMLILAIATIQLTRAGVSEERINELGAVVLPLVLHEMELAGWNLKGIVQIQLQNERGLDYV